MAFHFIVVHLDGSEIPMIDGVLLGQYLNNFKETEYEPLKGPLYYYDFTTSAMPAITAKHYRFLCGKDYRFIGIVVKKCGNLLADIDSNNELGWRRLDTRLDFLKESMREVLAPNGSFDVEVVSFLQQPGEETISAICLCDLAYVENILADIDRKSFIKSI